MLQFQHLLRQDTDPQSMKARPSESRGQSQLSGAPYLFTSTDRTEDRRRSKMTEIRTQTEQDLMQECTFHPDVHSRRPDIVTLEGIEARRQARVQSFLNEKAKHLTYRPVLITAPPKSRDTSTPVYERLHALSARSRSASLQPSTPHSVSSMSFRTLSESSTPRGNQKSWSLYQESRQRKARQEQREVFASVERQAQTANFATSQSFKLFLTGIEKEVAQFFNTRTGKSTGALSALTASIPSTQPEDLTNPNGDQSTHILANSDELKQLFIHLRFLASSEKPSENYVVELTSDLVSDAWDWLDRGRTGNIGIYRIMQFIREVYAPPTLSISSSSSPKPPRDVLPSFRTGVNARTPKGASLRALSPRLVAASGPAKTVTQDCRPNNAHPQTIRDRFKFFRLNRSTSTKPLTGINRPSLVPTAAPIISRKSLEILNEIKMNFSPWEKRKPSELLNILRNSNQSNYTTRQSTSRQAPDITARNNSSITSTHSANAPRSTHAATSSRSASRSNSVEPVTSRTDSAAKRTASTQRPTSTSSSSRGISSNRFVRADESSRPVTSEKNKSSWADRLYNEGKSVREKRISIQQEAIKKLEDKELSACTFKPLTNPKSSAVHKSKAIVFGFERATERFNNAHKKAIDEALYVIEGSARAR